MREEIGLKIICAVVFSGLIIWMAYSQYYSESRQKNAEPWRLDQSRYRPYLSIGLPVLFIVIGVLELLINGVQSMVSLLVSMCFDIFFLICGYYVILLVLLPVLRRYISSRACAMLWMIPNGLYYLFVVQWRSFRFQKPRWVICAPEKVVWTVFCIWGAGFAFVLIWKIISHIIFRRSILREAKIISDPEILSIFEQEAENANYENPKFKLVYSDRVRTPLSIGLFNSTMRIVLPYKSFSEEELKLIFRHELIHIGHEDAWTKFFMVFCTAICWFNPLMWIAMRKSADDIELSCDETVLIDCNDASRKQYADIILKTAGDERGFTTCLSASANAMRYRLKSIMRPSKRWNGVFFVGIACFSLIMSYGYTALAYEEHTGSEVIFFNHDTKLFTSEEVFMGNGEDDTEYDSVDVSALNEYLANQIMLDIRGDFSLGDEKYIQWTCEGPDGSYWIQLEDSYVKILTIETETIEDRVYYLPNKVDWEYIDSILQGDS